MLKAPHPEKPGEEDPVLAEETVNADLANVHLDRRASPITGKAAPAPDLVAAKRSIPHSTTCSPRMRAGELGRR
jgi:hypothetical protein